MENSCLNDKLFGLCSFFKGHSFYLLFYSKNFVKFSSNFIIYSVQKLSKHYNNNNIHNKQTKPVEIKKSEISSMVTVVSCFK